MGRPHAPGGPRQRGIPAARQTEGVRLQDRVHFFALSAQTMRRILIDAARARRAGKPGGQELRVTLDHAVGTGHRGEGLVRQDDALAALASIGERKARVIELRLLAG